MHFSILVTAAPYSNQGAATAYRFCKTALTKHQKIARIFFYGDGVYNANALITPPQDEFNLVSAWQQLAEQYHVELIVCVAAALRRGILDHAEAQRHDKTAANLASGFKIAGLGQLIEDMTTADRFMVFK
jgi:tRNA 2-thiouridine synthesizing protein D